MTYKPKPIDTSGVKLPRSLRKLTEELAENNHDLWSKKRMAEGWTYGPERNDRKKTNPDLIPYCDLLESEKNYDRITAIEGLKAIVALGYKIEAPSKSPSPDSGYPHRVIQEMMSRLRSPEELDLQTLLDVWAFIGSEHYAGSAKVYSLLSNRILKAGEPLLAYDVITTGLKHWPENVRLRQLQGLALARSCATERANEVLTRLYDDAKTDGETLGILARTHKDLATLAGTAQKKKKELTKAHDCYHEGYRQAISAKKRGWRDDALYNGINAATIALLMGQSNRAKNLARKVRTICMDNLKMKKQDYWTVATLGEAGVILGDWKEAEEQYSLTGELGRENYGDLSTTRRQARILLGFLGKDKHLFDHCSNIPKVVVFAGHMVDQPGRTKPRFPQSMEKTVRKAIEVRLEQLDARIGFASASCGADILFLEEMLKRKGEINVILPFEAVAFLKATVDIIPEGAWKRKFNRVLKHAKSVIIASEQRFSRNDVAYQYSNLLQHGLAMLRADTLDTEVVPLAVWDGRPGDGPWGTASFVKYWRSQGLGPEIIDIAGLFDDKVHSHGTSYSKPIPANIGTLTGNPPELPQEIKAVLFADVVGYSNLKDEEIPGFVDHFMGLVAEIVNASPFKPLTRNTWGDALYFVFKSPQDAGNFALRLRDRIRRTLWKKKGLPEDLNLRISLHAGPLYRCRDPVIKRYKYTGSHVSRAARIEPITPPGEIYASQAFAALAAAQGVDDFALEYVERAALPKKSGIVPLYLVRRRTR